MSITLRMLAVTQSDNTTSARLLNHPRLSS
jgi:hypothetical protein